MEKKTDENEHDVLSFSSARYRGKSGTHINTRKRMGDDHAQCIPNRILLFHFFFFFFLGCKDKLKLKVSLDCSCFIHTLIPPPNILYFPHLN